MIKFDFKKKNAHFWIALSYGFTYFLQGLLGMLDSYLEPLHLSWKAYTIWPLSIVEDMPWTLIICIAGLLLFMDGLRIFKRRWQRFCVWLLMMLCLWGLTGLIIYTTVVLDPHPVGFTLTNLAATISYSLLFLKGPPLVGKDDLTWED